MHKGEYDLRGPLFGECQTYIVYNSILFILLGKLLLKHRRKLYEKL